MFPDIYKFICQLNGSARTRPGTHTESLNRACETNTQARARTDASDFLCDLSLNMSGSFATPDQQLTVG